MAYKNYDDGEYEFDGNVITVKDGSFEMNGKKYAGFGYDDGTEQPILERFGNAVGAPFLLAISPLSIIVDTWNLATGNNGDKCDYFLADIDPSSVRRIDAPEAKSPEDEPQPLI